MKAALLEVSHWHFPLYQEALRSADIEIVGVSDRDETHRERVAAYFGCPAFADWRELAVLEGMDLAFAFGRHAEMPEVAEALIRRGTPFAIEKPCGVNAGQVARLRQMAADHNIYVATPFIFRLSDLLTELRRLAGTGKVSFNHMAFRFIAGPLSRYESGSAWMLDPATAGGGCTINLAVHFVDLFRILTGQEVKSVSALMNHKSQAAPVEDYSMLALTAADGTIGVIETGYGFPGDSRDQREFSFTLSSDRYYVRSDNEAIRIRDRSKLAKRTTKRPLRLETDIYYAVFVERVLADLQAGRSPVAGLEDAEAAMRIIDAGYASARDGGASKTP